MLKECLRGLDDDCEVLASNSDGVFEIKNNTLTYQDSEGKIVLLKLILTKEGIVDFSDKI